MRIRLISILLFSVHLLIAQQTTTSTVTDYDGNVYQTVKIGSQWWMAENLRTTHYADGTAIPYFSETKTTSANDYKDYYSYPNHDAGNTSGYGLLYSWGVIANQDASVRKNLLGNGWAVPDTTDWATLTNYLGGKYVAGGKLKREDLWTTPNTSATDEAGFHALPAGDCNTGGFSVFGTQARFWTPQLVDAGQAGRIYMFLANNSAAIQKGQYRNINTLSLRLLKKSTSTDLQTTVEKPEIVRNSNNEITINQIQSDSQVSIYSCAGEEIIRWNISPNNCKLISISTLKTGIYILHISNKYSQTTYKFSKQ